MESLEELLTAKARRMGAVDVVSFTLEDIVFDSRTILKCMFGCEDWGYNHTCPSRPGSLQPWEYRKIFAEYDWGLIIHTHDKKPAHEISFELERIAFMHECYFAFSLSDCALCEVCAGFHGERCRNPKKARPAFHSVGIDVFETVRNFGLPLSTLQDESERQNWYAAVFVE